MDAPTVSYTNRGVVVVESGEGENPKVGPVALHPLTSDAVPASSEGDEHGHGRKVSFYSDVTVYVFDQESPTRRLQCHWPGETCSGSLMPVYGDNPKISGQSPTPPGTHLNHLPRVVDSSEDIGVSLEWEDDFTYQDSALKTRMGDHHLIISESIWSSPTSLMPTWSSERCVIRTSDWISSLHSQDAPVQREKQYLLREDVVMGDRTTDYIYSGTTRKHNTSSLSVIYGLYQASSQAVTPSLFRPL
ncbi:hypothetical protein DPEC_G00357380 [Dallia pectoralis]|uniref:Uncharacterized protein n=1 Tax=Dallia pectoralis TaxID=75939 RepID=A0ACC2F029_DALPE|nr:hypothetical protein DPEC_G00357380 [Dallia pectoralis]